MIDALLIVAGLVLLYFGAEWLVAGAARLAESFGVQPLIVGLTVVAYGTSSPELVVGIDAALRGQGDIALGNVVGSNVANLGLILGLVAVMAPPRIDPSLRGREVAVLLASTLLIPAALLDGTVQWWDGVALLGLAAGYTWWMVHGARADAAAAARIHAVGEAAADISVIPRGVGRGRMAALALVGLGILVVGGHLLVDGAVGVARLLGLSERMIGLTIVAVGTSIPELATSIVAARRGHSDLAVGNVIGSNIFNVLLILGASSVTRSIHAAPRDLALDLGVLAAMTALVAIVIRARDRVGRPVGAVLVTGYVAFLVALAVTARAA